MSSGQLGSEPAPGQPEVDLELWIDHVRYAQRADRAARDRLIAHYHPYVEALARKLYRGGEPLDDLVQLAYEGLLLALRRFEPERRRPFPAYARPTIVGVIQRHYRDLGWSVRIPRRAQELSGHARDAREMLVQDLGREPTNAEIADFLDVEEEDLRQAQLAEGARHPGSLDVVDPVTKLQMEQVVGGPAPELERCETRVALRQAMELLSAEDHDLLWRYFVNEQTQTEVAEDLGCSQMQVSRLIGTAVRRLRGRVVPSG